MIKPKQHTFMHMRRPDWTVRWIEFMKDSQDIASDLALDWQGEGVTCTSWCGDAIEVLTGHNPFEPFRGTFDGVLGAVKVIKKAGFNSLDDLIASLFPEVPVGMAQQGDLALVRTTRWSEESGDGLFAEEVMPHGVAMIDPPAFWAVTEGGLGRGDLYVDAVRAFAVGRLV
jgi:hypothetical protein